MQQVLARNLKHPHFKAVLPFAWFGFLIFGIFSTLSLLLLTVTDNNYLENVKYTIYSAKPLVLGASTTNVNYADSRAASIDRVMSRYNCPMTGLGETFVKEADKHNIPYWVVASIAFQESTCGKNTAKKNGEETYNAYGYGVWGTNVKAFDSWEHGIEVMSKYMSDMFYSKNVDDLCVIMKTYTPPSQGSWCEGVGYFRDEILYYQSPET